MELATAVHYSLLADTKNRVQLRAYAFAKGYAAQAVRLRTLGIFDLCDRDHGVRIRREPFHPSSFTLGAWPGVPPALRLGCQPCAEFQSLGSVLAGLTMVREKPSPFVSSYQASL